VWPPRDGAATLDALFEHRKPTDARTARNNQLTQYTRSVNVLSDIRLSVGQTWLFSRGSTPTVSTDNRGYRDVVKSLKSGEPPVGFKLPWPLYRSTLWGNLFGVAYMSIGSYQLVSGLLPLLLDELVKPQTLNSATGAPIAFVYSSEALFHPFAVTTVLHVRILGQQQPWQTDADAVTFLEQVRSCPVDGQPSWQVRDGVPLSKIPGLPAKDAEGKDAAHSQASQTRFMLLSALHQDGDPAADSYRLASLYKKKASNQSQPMNTEGSAISVTDRSAGMLMPADVIWDKRLQCIHHNMSTLLAYIQNLAAVLPGQPTQQCKWFQGRAALLLNHLYRRATFSDINGIYKSRLAGMWIDHLSLNGAINQLTAREVPPPPTI
jgi:hypothetical protein